MFLSIGNACTILLRRAPDLRCFNGVMFDDRDWLPSQPCGITNRMQLGRTPAVEYNVEPEVSLEPLRGVVFIGCQRDLANTSPAFHFDKADVNGSVRILGVGPAGDQVEAPVLTLDTLHHSSLRLFMSDGTLHGDPFDLGILHHGSNTWRRAVGMRQHPGPPEASDVSDHALPLLLKL